MGSGEGWGAGGKVEGQLIPRLFQAIKGIARQTARGGCQDTNALRQQHGGEPQHRSPATAGQETLRTCTAPRAYYRNGIAGLLSKHAAPGPQYELQDAADTPGATNLPHL